MGLHWWHGTAADVVNQGFYGLKPLAGTSTVFVAPQGIDNAWPNTNGQDVTFVDDVLRTVEAALCIDTTQRFATGFSYGGGMSNALACARADVFRAVAVLNGAQLSGLRRWDPAHRVPRLPRGRGRRPEHLAGPRAAGPRPAEQRVPVTAGDRAGRGQRYPHADRVHVPRRLPGRLARVRQRAPVGRARPRAAAVVGARGGLAVLQLPDVDDADPTPTPTATPTPTPTPTPTASPTSPPAGGCSATYRTVNFWPGGFQGEVTVRAGAAATSWSVSWRPSGERVDQVWNGTVTTQGDLVVVRNVAWNGQLPTGGTTTFGLLGSGTSPTPTLTCTSS